MRDISIRPVCLLNLPGWNGSRGHDKPCCHVSLLGHVFRDLSFNIVDMVSKVLEYARRLSAFSLGVLVILSAISPMKIVDRVVEIRFSRVATFLSHCNPRMIGWKP